ncbi:hypothetical protein IQ250_15290 [Pseudanabaenaceae cyanobacterium LEGE 13415]|nr:hypothetical protein [Pseudanabaenaceae cyanobacterium LEGE 13415]
MDKCPISRDLCFQEEAESANTTADDFKRIFQAWLKRSKLSEIVDQLRSLIAQTTALQILVQSQNYQIWQLPWHEWSIFQDAEVSLTFQTGQSVIRSVAEPRSALRILAVFGSPEGINLDQDYQEIERLGSQAVEVKFLSQPNRREFYEALWNEQGWDIFFFAGHSTTLIERGQAGVIQLNLDEVLTIPEI